MNGSYAEIPKPSFQQTFTLAVARDFARFSGDYNPIHLDHAASRKTPTGFPVAHGMSVVLWALEQLYESIAPNRSIVRLSVIFLKYIFIDSAATLSIKRNDGEKIRAEVVGATGQAIRLDIGLAPSNSTQEIPPSVNREVDCVKAAAPRVLTFGDLLQASGRIEIETETVADMFPKLSTMIGAVRVRALATLSMIVGMRCPGLHSIFGSVAVEFNSDFDDLRYRSTMVDERFSLVEIAVDGGGIQGTITAFLRDAPASVDLNRVRSLVAPREFSDVSALVIGASRGLGAATAAIISAGGGRVIGTYRTFDDAVERFESSLTNTRLVQHDVLGDAEDLIRTIPEDVNQLYYFATPHIFRRNTSSFDVAQFAMFSDFYVAGFARIVEQLSAPNRPILRVFYPSSTAIDEMVPDMLEYRIAKVAGEMLCQSFSNRRDLSVLVKRLSRIKTDQTGNVVPVPAEDPLEAMLPLIREMATH